MGMKIVLIADENFFFFGKIENGSNLTNIIFFIQKNS